MQNKKFNWLAIIIIIVAIVATYSNHYNNTFHFDDSHTIQNNLYIKNIKNIPLFFKDASTFSTLPTNQSYRPIVSTTLAIDYWIGQSLEPFWFQFSATIWHTVLCVLIYFLFLKINLFVISENKQKFIALFATLLFAVHPTGAETVNYIIQRGDLQSTFFVVLAMVMYLYSKKSKKYYLYLLPVFIGSLAKITTVMFAPILLTYIFLIEKNYSFLDLFQIKKVKSIFSIAFITLLVSALTYLFIRKMDSQAWVSGGTSTYFYAITQPYVILLYTLSFFAPIHLSADTDLFAFNSILNIKAILGIAFLLALFFILIWSSTQQKLKGISFGIAWYLLCLLPTSSIIPFSEVMNDHRVFLPYIGLCIAVVHAVFFLLEKTKNYFISNKEYEKSLLVFFTLSVLIFAYGAYQRNKVWLSEESLWHDVVNKSPNNGRGLMNYGLVLMGKGDYNGAEQYFLKSLKINPTYHYLLINLAILYNEKKDIALAEQYFLKAIQYANNNPNPYFFYGKFLLNQNRIAEAENYFKQTLIISNVYFDARYFLMEIFYNQNKKTELEELCKETLALNKNDMRAIYYTNIDKPNTNFLNDKKFTADEYVELSLQFYNKNEFTKSIEFAKKAIEINPKSARAFNNIGAAYGAMMVWEKQVEYCSKALEIEPNFEVAKNNIIWAKQQIEQIQQNKKQ